MARVLFATSKPLKLLNFLMDLDCLIPSGLIGNNICIFKCRMLTFKAEEANLLMKSVGG